MPYLLHACVLINFVTLIMKEGDFNKLRHGYISFIVRFQILWPLYLYQNIWHFKFAPSQELYINVLEILIKGTITRVFWIFQT